MSLIAPSRDMIALLRDIRAALYGDVPTLRKLAQEVTLQDVDAALTDIDAKTPALGPAAPAASVPVVLASGSMVDTSLQRTLIDAFGRLRTSDIVTIFDSKQISDNQSIFWDTATTGTGAATYDATEAHTVLSTAAAGDAAARQTYRRFNYQPGKSQLIYMTGVIRNAGAFDAGRISRIGQFDANAGLFFQYDEATGIQVGIRKNGVDTLIPQASWNLDAMDGTGPSGITLDVTQTQIFTLNYEWLAVGSAWFGFVIGGSLYWAHRNDNSNVTDTVYMQTPNLPLRYEITATAPGAGSMTQICSSINSEGGNDPNGKVLSIARLEEATANPANPNPEKVLLVLRYRDLNAAQVDIDVQAIGGMGQGGTTEYNVMILRLVRDAATQLRNETDTGPPVLTFAPITGSALEVARPQDTVDEAFVVSDNLLGTSGVVIFAQYNLGRSVIPSGPIRNSLKLGMSIAGVSDLLVLSVYPINSTPNILGSITWREL